MKIASDPANLAGARKRLEAFACEHGFGSGAAGEIGLCVNEALTNIMRHAYAGAVNRPIEIEARMSSDGSAMHVRIRDWGSGVRPPPAPSENLHPDSPGGLGLLCMGKMMDQVRYAPRAVGMELTLQKGRAGDECDRRSE